MKGGRWGEGGGLSEKRFTLYFLSMGEKHKIERKLRKVFLREKNLEKKGPSKRKREKEKEKELYSKKRALKNKREKERELERKTERDSETERERGIQRPPYKTTSSSKVNGIRAL